MLAHLSEYAMRTLGDHYEQLAQAFLRQQGLNIITTNYTAHRTGEIDIIAYHDEPQKAGGVCPTLVFVEVKMRKISPNARYGQAMETVTRAKQNKIIKTAEHFLAYGGEFLQNLGLTASQKQALAYRFDVIAFDVPPIGQAGQKSNENRTKTHWLRNAFLVE